MVHSTQNSKVRSPHAYVGVERWDVYALTHAF